MRPKKIVVCFNENDSELSVTKFLLETNGYRVLTASTSQEAVAKFSSARTVDLVIVREAEVTKQARPLVARLKSMASHVPMIILAPRSEMEGIHVADAMLPVHACSPAELLERIKVMSARKRGPRKGTPRDVAQHVVEALA